MRIVRLAQLLEHKYRLKVTAEGGVDERKIQDIRKSIMDAFENYINPTTVKPAYNILPLLYTQGEKYSEHIMWGMQHLVDELDKPDLYSWFEKIQEVLNTIAYLQAGGIAPLRQSLNDAFPLRRESDRNRREMAKSKFENVVFKKLASILYKISKSINVALGKNMPIAARPSEPTVKDPSKEDQKRFRLTAAARAYHLDNDEVFRKFWNSPLFKREVIRIINSAKWRSGKAGKPKFEWHNDPILHAETEKLMQAVMAEEAKKQTNEGLLSAPEQQAQQMLTQLPPEEEWSRQMLDAKQQKALEQEEETQGSNPEKVEEAIKQRDLEHAKRQEEMKKEQEALLSKYNGLSFDRWLRSQQ